MPPLPLSPVLPPSVPVKFRPQNKPTAPSSAKPPRACTSMLTSLPSSTPRPRSGCSAIPPSAVSQEAFSYSQNGAVTGVLRENRPFAAKTSHPQWLGINPQRQGIDFASLGMNPFPLGIDFASLGMNPFPLGIDRAPLGMNPFSLGIDFPSLGINPQRQGIDGERLGIDRPA